jgi:hypothetical protein
MLCWVTVRFTLIVIAGVDEFGKARLIWLEYGVVLAASVFATVGLILTLIGKLGLMAPLSVLIWSHAPPVPGVTCAVKLALPPLLISVKTCTSGTGPPCGCVKVSELEGVTVTLTGGFTVNAYGMLTDPLGRLADVIVIEPL